MPNAADRLGMMETERTIGFSTVKMSDHLDKSCLQRAVRENLTVEALREMGSGDLPKENQNNL